MIAHAAGQLAAELGQSDRHRLQRQSGQGEILDRSLDRSGLSGVRRCARGPRFGPVAHATGGPSAAYIQKVFDLVKPVVQATIELLSAGQRQVQDRQKELVAHVAALKDFLDKNAPADRHLVPDGAEFPIALLPNVGLGPAAAPLAKQTKTSDHPIVDLPFSGPTRFFFQTFKHGKG